MREGLHKIAFSGETIVAVSTPAGRGAIGIVRISGSLARGIAERLFQSKTKLQHRRVHLGSWRHANGDVLDKAMVTLAESPNSYTGEDVVEISAHGNPIILSRMVEDICAAGARVAQPGEFTLRAVANGKMDLVQAEAIRDFIEAQTEAQARTALHQVNGALSKRIQPTKERLINLIAELEAGIDFAEDDVSVPTAEHLVPQLQKIAEELNAIAGTFEFGRLMTQGLRVAIAGKPNVGKSSLFNRLLNSDRAIVTDTPGTTRDVITEAVNLDGVPLRLADTAGLRDTTNKVEGLGVGRSLEEVAGADLTLAVFDGSREFDLDDERVLERVSSVPHIVIVNKSDLKRVLVWPTAVREIVAVSASTGNQMEVLLDCMRQFLLDRKSDLAEDLVLTNVRQHAAVVRAGESSQKALSAIQHQVPHEMVLLDLYDALEGLNELTGEVVTEDILGRIFSTFCIGK